MATRRSLLAALALAGPASALAAGPGAPPTLLIAGPEGGNLDRLSAVLAPALGHALPQNTPLARAVAGGPDGVTGANQFDARTPPDGQTVLMVPGAAALAWLAGDSRAHFDAARWVPLLAAFTPAVVVGRAPLADLAAAGRTRLASAGPVGPDTAALLALDLLGIRATPIAAPEGERRLAPIDGADLILLHGRNVPQQLQAARAQGLQAAFTFGLPTESGQSGAEPLLPELPDFAAFARVFRGAPPDGALYAAWRSLAAASQLEFALVLPQLTPAALVSLWRRAGAQIQTALDLQATAAANGFRTLASPAVNATTSTIAADTGTLLALRQWLTARLNWNPG